MPLGKLTLQIKLSNFLTASYSHDRTENSKQPSLDEVHNSKVSRKNNSKVEVSNTIQYN